MFSDDPLRAIGIRRVVRSVSKVARLRVGDVFRWGQLCFEVGDAAVLEPQVGSGGLESFVEGAVVGGELLQALLERGVLGRDALDRVLGPVRFEVADAAEEFTDVGRAG